MKSPRAMRALLSARSLRNRGCGLRRTRERGRGRRHGGQRFSDALPLKNSDDLHSVDQPGAPLPSDQARANGPTDQPCASVRLTGVRLTGHLAWPRKPRVKPPTLLVMFPSGFPVWGRPAGDPNAQFFADQDLAVAWLHHRSDAGVRGEDVPPLLAAVERAEVDDPLKCRPAPQQSARPLQRSRTRKTTRLTADRIRKRD